MLQVSVARSGVDHAVEWILDTPAAVSRLGWVSTDPAMRASDADREAVAGRLRDAHAEGRLTMEEFEERLDATYAARTLGDLAPVTHDLPAAPATSLTTSAERSPVWQGHRAAWAAWASAVFVCVAIWGASAMSGGEHPFWPIWVAGPWGALLLARMLFEERQPRERPGRRDGEVDHR
jgi:hypothetical protein